MMRHGHFIADGQCIIMYACGSGTQLAGQVGFQSNQNRAHLQIHTAGRIGSIIINK